MKKGIIFIIALLLNIGIFAQAPNKMSYQTVIRNASGIPVNGLVGIRISIYQNAIGGTPVYVETHITTTNINGLASLEIGNGTIVLGTIAGIDLSTGPYFIKTEADPSGGANYTISGSSEMLSVPYALYAGNGSWTKNGNNIYNSNAGNVGIGTNTPLEKLDVAGIGSFGVGGKLKIFNDGNGILSNQAGAFRMYTGVNTGYIWYINNVERMRMSSAGNLGIGNNAPTAKLDVAGSVKIVNGSEGAGKVLTSDAAGLTSWTGPIGFQAIGGSGTFGPGSVTTRIFPDEVYDDGNGYNPATGIYTVPETGTYVLYFSEGFTGNPGASNWLNYGFEINGAAYYNNITPGPSYWGIQLSRTMHLVAGDNIFVRYYNATGLTLYATETTNMASFSVHKIK